MNIFQILDRNKTFYRPNNQTITWENYWKDFLINKNDFKTFSVSYLDLFGLVGQQHSTWSQKLNAQSAQISAWEYITATHTDEPIPHTHLPLSLEKPSDYSFSYKRRGRGGNWEKSVREKQVWLWPTGDIMGLVCPGTSEGGPTVK